MAKYYRRRRFYRKKHSWNIEQRASRSASNAWQTITSDGSFNRQILFPVVNATGTEGVRKVKNIGISMSITSNPNHDTSHTANPIYWALIYCPEGTIINELKFNGELYQPSQYVINSGIIDPENTNKYRISSKLARNLKANDRIYLLLGQNATDATNDRPAAINWLCRYAICFN